MEANNKIFTSMEQSKKLAEILPAESADMCYIQDLLGGGKYGEYKPYIGDKIPSYGQGKIRCWSLSALLGVIPQPDISRKSPDIFRNLEGTWSIRSRVSSEFAQQVDGYINLVDACVDMILELHRFKKL
jgi:hypothetical protein